MANRWERGERAAGLTRGRAAAMLLGALSPLALSAAVVALQPTAATVELNPADAVSAAERGLELPEWPACERREDPSGLPLAAARRVSSTLALVRFEGEGAQARTVAYVADEDARELRVVDHMAGVELAHHRLNGKPEQLLVADDGRVFVSLADRAQLVVLEPGQQPEDGLSERCRVQTGPEPAGMALTPAGDALLVASRWGQTLSGHDTTGEMRRQFELPVGRDPYGVAVSSDGKRAFVSHVVGGQLSVIELPKPERVKLVALKRKDMHMPFGGFGIGPDIFGSLEMGSIGGLASSNVQLDATPRASVSSGGAEPEPVIGFLGVGDGMLGTVLRMPDPVPVDRTGTHGFSLVVTDDGRVMIPLVLSAPGKVDGHVGGYGGGSFSAPTMVGAIASVDERSGQLKKMPTGSRSSMTKDCLLPRAAAWDGERGTVLVACQGANKVMAYDHAGDKPTRRAVYEFPSGDGPTGIAIDGKANVAVVWSQFDATVSVASLPDPKGKEPEVTRHALEHRGAPDAEVALGRSLFHQSNQRRIAADGRACASCHPSGREDGLTWATLEGPRQTPMLMSRIGEAAAPFGWNGKKNDVDAHLQRTLTRLRGSGLDESERRALVAYVGSMSPPQPPAAAANLVKEGEALFADASTGCVGCHAGNQTADGIAHDVGSTAAGDRLREFDTPSLRHIGQTAPYYHDGRYATLEAMLTDEHIQMGHVDQLNDHDIEALTAFLRSL